MTFPEIPADVAAKVKRIFRSDKRKAIAMELLYFDHWPTVEEKKRIADTHEMHITSIDQTLYILRDADFFTKKQGSIPLYRVKLGKEVDTPDIQDRQDSEDEATDNSHLFDSDSDNKEDENDSKEGKERDLQENRLRKIEATIHNQGESIENFMAEIRSTISQLSVDPPKNNPDLVEENPDSVEDLNPVTPFTGMTGEQVYEMLLNQPGDFRQVIGLPDRSPQGDIQAVPVTVRKVIVDVTTYTLTCYEKAVNDGAFDGTFSDFMNQCVYKYFEDRGLALGWHKIEQMRRFSS